jgi:hypothetical protein
MWASEFGPNVSFENSLIEFFLYLCFEYLILKKIIINNNSIVKYIHTYLYYLKQVLI